MAGDERTHPALERVAPARHRLGNATSNGRIRIFVDGEAVEAYEGESVAAALLAAAVDRPRLRAGRVTRKRGEPRGAYCGIGLCFDCVTTIDGCPNVRTCRTVVTDGMQISLQQGDGAYLTPSCVRSVLK